jgi:predicted phosphodiesterase
VNEGLRFTRRDLLRRGFVVLSGPALAGAALAGRAAEDDGPRPKVRVGLVTDLHYADKDPLIHRYYRETPAKFAEAARRFREDKTDVVIELGDLIDVGQSPAAEKGALKRIVKDFRATPGQHHCVLGNHCVWSLTKAEFLEIAGQKRSYYSFDAGGCHFVILDACFRGDGEPYGRRNFQWSEANLPPAELDWLRADLKRAPRKSLVFIHQRLDAGPPYGVQNAEQVRKILEASGKVLAVLQGHYHVNDYQQLGGIHYVTLAAMVEGSGAESNAYAVMDVLPGDAIRIRGFRRQKGYELKPAAAKTQ